MLGPHSIEYTDMEVSQVYLNGHRFLQDERPLMLGLSPGNTYYYRKESLERLFDFAARKKFRQGKLFYSSSSEKCVEKQVEFSCFY